MSQLPTYFGTNIWGAFISVPKLAVCSADWLLGVINYTTPFPTNAQGILYGQFIQDCLD